MFGLNLGLTILAGVLVVVALLLLWWRSRVSQDVALMASTPTSKAAEAAKLTPGTLAEVKGIVRCGQPLTGEFSQKPCVYFRAEINREEVYYERDSDGRQQRRTRTTTVHSNIKHAPCHVEDDSGRIAVNLEGAEVEAEKTIDQIETPETVSAVIGTMVTLLTGNNTTYRRNEWTIGTDVPVYLLGEIQPGGSIGTPAKGSRNRKFVISTKSEEERTKDLGSTMTWLFWIMVILLIAAAGSLYAAWRVGAG
jgi:hypothetical protein